MKAEFHSPTSIGLGDIFEIRCVHRSPSAGHFNYCRKKHCSTLILLLYRSPTHSFAFFSLALIHIGSSCPTCYSLVFSSIPSRFLFFRLCVSAPPHRNAQPGMSSLYLLWAFLLAWKSAFILPFKHQLIPTQGDIKLLTCRNMTEPIPCSSICLDSTLLPCDISFTFMPCYLSCPVLLNSMQRLSSAHSLACRQAEKGKGSTESEEEGEGSKWGVGDWTESPALVRERRMVGRGRGREKLYSVKSRRILLW